MSWRISYRLPTSGLASGLGGLALLLACTVALPSSRTSSEPGPDAVEREIALNTSTSVSPVQEEGDPPSPDAAAQPAARVAEPASLERHSEPPASPIRLRVGLGTDLEAAWVPCCGERLILGVGDRRWVVRSPLRVLPDAASSRQGIFRLQVAALKDEAQAAGLARRLAERTGYAADSHFDAGVDLYRVRVGRFASREEADAAREHLAGEGVIDAWIVGEGAGVVDPAFLLLRQGEADAGGPKVRLTGRWMSVEAPDSEGVPGLSSRRPGVRYRGRLWLYLNNRGKLNLINELDLDEYLRSVVASEMGPDVYGRPEALKAQAVAARTYTLKHLGEFSDEGYDICATPRCQVYRGMAAEHPRSDLAVSETSRQVLLWRGELIDARYSSSCGGHTEDVATVFPLERAPYLRGVPCAEAGEQRLRGTVAAGTPFPAGLSRRLLPLPSGAERDPRSAFEGRLFELARQAFLAVPRDRLASLERGEVRRFVGSLFDLALDRKLLQPSVELASMLREAPDDWSPEQLRQASLLQASGLLEGASRDPLTPDERERLLLSLARLLRVVRQERTHFVSVRDGELTVRGGNGVTRRLPLPADLATFRYRGEWTTAAHLHLLPGDRLDLLYQGDDLVAAVQPLSAGTEAAPLRSRYASWRRFKTDAELARRTSVYYPGLGFTGFEVLSRGVSGRVGKIRITGAGGRLAEVEGLAVRWTLDLPDTRFEARRTRSEDGRPGWLFTGSGWGHGVGLCQIGAVNLAGRGLSYREILEHYYTGVELALVRHVGGRWERDPAPLIPVADARR